MTEQWACDINFFFYTRFLFGFYYEFHTSKPVRWLAKFYCCLISITMVSFFNILNVTGVYASPLLYAISTEYLFYVICSFVMGNKYLLQYYKKTPLIDSSARTYRPLRVHLMTYIGVMFFTRSIGFMKNLLVHTNYTIKLHCFDFMDYIMWFVILIGRSPLLLVFALLYTRVKLMRETLESNNFDCRNQGKDHPRQYMQIYETIVDELEKANDSMKLQLLVFGMSSVVYYLIDTMHVLYYLRDYHSYLSLTTKFELVWFMSEIVLSWSPMFISAVLGDLVSMEMQNILAIIIERQVSCKNERDRAEIQKLFHLIRNRPLKFNIWRVVPLNVRTVLSFASFTFTTLIALIQIKHWLM